jgi:hypothetical protein
MAATSSLPSASTLSPFTLGATGASAVLSQSAPQYSTSTYYSISVAPPAGAGVQLTFSLFETEPSYDTVTVYNDTTLTQGAGTVLLNALSGSRSGLALVGAANAVLTVVLSTDSSSNFAGLAFSAAACFAQADGSCLGLASPSPTPSPTPSVSPTPRVLGGGADAARADPVGVGIGAAFGVLAFVAIAVVATIAVVRAQQRAKNFGGPMAGPASAVVVTNSPLSMMPQSAFVARPHGPPPHF